MGLISKTDLLQLNKFCAVAIGFFDGVHLGHQAVIKNAVNYANKHNILSVVITFDRSPKVVLGYAEDDGQITPLTEKINILKSMGVDYILAPAFDETFLNLSANAFVENYLIEIRAKYVAVGFDFRFGFRGSGDASQLVENYPFQAHIIHQVTVDQVKISTTMIKQLIKDGDFEPIYHMLNRNFAISGIVVPGRQLGKKIGFATANLELSENFILPKPGVYATITQVGKRIYKSMTNIGVNPTVTNINKMTIETHIFEFNEDIYGDNLHIEFVDRIRDETKFDNLETLVNQLKMDKLNAKKLVIFE